LVGGHGNYKTGLNYVLMFIAKALEKNGYSISYASISGGDTRSNYISGKYPFFDCTRDPRLFRDAVERVRPDIVITFDDIWHLERVEYARDSYPFLWIHYLITEEANLSPLKMTRNNDQMGRVDLRPSLQRCDIVVPCTEMAEQVGKSWRLSNLTPIIRPPIPDSTFSFNKAQRKEFREKNGYGADDFVFLLVVRNFIRKNIPFVLQALSSLIISYRRQNVEIKPKLFMHVPRMPQIPLIGYDMDYLISIYENAVTLKDSDKAERFLKLSTENPEDLFQTMTDQEMNRIYSGCDCMISLPYAEGIGYPPIEGGLTNLPVIYGQGGYPKFYLGSNPEENFKVETDYHFVPPGMNQVWYSSDMKSTVEAMNQAVQKYVHGKRASKNRESLIKFFGNNSGKEWANLVESLISKYSNKGIPA